MPMRATNVSGRAGSATAFSADSVQGLTELGAYAPLDGALGQGVVRPSPTDAESRFVGSVDAPGLVLQFGCLRAEVQQERHQWGSDGCTRWCEVDWGCGFCGACPQGLDAGFDYGLSHALP